VWKASWEPPTEPAAKGRTPTRASRLKLQGHTAPVYAVCFSLDSERLMSGGDDEAVKVSFSRARESLPHTAHVSQTCCSVSAPDEGRGGPALTHDAAPRQVWNVKSGDLLATLATGMGRIRGLRFARDATGLCERKPEFRRSASLE